MRTSSELLVTFLLNACWQVPVIAGAAAVGSWLLKDSSARYRHRIWVTALLLSLVLPLLATWRIALNSPENSTLVSSIPAIALSESTLLKSSPLSTTAPPPSQTGAVTLNWFLAQAIIAIYSAFLLFGAYRFLKACFATRAIKRSAHPAVITQPLDHVIERCQKSIGVQNVQILSSESLPVPVTLGVFNPVIILPESLVREGDQELLTSAIAHEFIHVARRDYVLNLAYELVYLLLSFNPASALLRRRIKQTRELSCDELVAERVIEPDVYARSLVTLASAAPPLRSLSINATVGIADADILEVRVMSLMNKSKLIPGSRKVLLLAVALLLAVPSVTAVALAMRFDVDPLNAAVQDQESKQKEKEKLKEKERSPEFEAGFRAGSQEVERKKAFNNEFAARNWREEEELKAKAIMQAELVRLARIPMDQAIQIATSQYPGKVLQSSLAATGWEELGRLEKDGKVFYHVTILGDDGNSATHVFVNAIDGTIIKTEKELPRKMRNPEQP